MPLRMGSKRKRVEKQSGRRPAHSSSGSSPQSQPITRQSPQPISRLSPQAITRQSPQPITRQSPKPQPAPRPSQRGLSPQPRSEATPYASTAVGSDTVARPVLKGWATERDLTGQRQPIIMSSTGSHVTSPAGRHAPLTAAKSSPVLNQDDIVNTVATPRDFTPRLDMTKSTPDIPDTANYENVQSPTSPKSPTWYQQRFPNRAVPAFDFSVPLSRRSAGSPRNSYVGGSPRNSYAGYSPAYSQSPNYPQSSNSSVYSPSSSNVDPSYQRSSGSYSQSYTSGNTTAYDDTPQRQQKSYDRRSLPPQFLQQQRQDFLKDNTKPDPANSLSSMPTTREEEEIDPEIAGLKPQPPNDLDLRPMYSPPAPPVRDISSLKYVGFNKNHEKYPSWPVTTGQPPPNLGGPPVDAHPVDAHLGDKVHTAGQSDSADSGKSQLAELNDKNSPGLERKGSDENKQPRNQSDPGFKQKPKKSFYTTRKPKFEPPKENNYENLKMEEERFNEFCEHSKSGYPPPKLDPDGHNYGDEKYNIPSPPERDVPNLDEKSLVQKIAAVISPSSQQSPFQFHQYNVNNYDNGASRFHKTDMATSPLQTVQSKVPGMYFQQAMNAQNLLHTPNGTSNSKNMVDSGTSPLSSPNDDRGREMLRTISANVRNDSTQSPLEKNRGLIIRQMPYYNTSTQTDHGLHSTEKLSGESQSRTSEGSGVGPMSRSSIGADGDSDQHKQLRHETNSDSQLSQQLSISTTQSISSLSHSSGIGSMSFSDHSSAPMLRKLSEEFYRGRLSGSMQNEKRFSSASSYEDPKSPRAESIYSGNLTQAESYSSVIIHPHETSGPFGSSPSLTSSKQDLSDMELETAADQRHSQFKPRYSMDSNIFNKSTTSMTSLPPRSLQESRFTSESNLSPANCTPRNHSQSMLQLSRPPSSLMENAQGRSNTYSSESSTSSRPHGSMEARSSGSRYGSDSATPGIPNQKPHLRTDSDSVFFDKPSPLPSEGQRTQSSQNKFTEHSVGVGRKESMKMAYGTFDENEHHYATPYAHQRNSSEVLSPNARDPATSHSRSSSFADYMPMHYNNSPNVNRLGEIKEEGSEVRWQEAVRKSKSLGHDMGNYINVEINKGELALQKGSDSDRSDTEKKKEITPGVKQTGSEPPRMRRHKDKKSADSTIAKSANDQSSGGESSKGSKSDAESIPQSGGQPLSESELKKLQQKAVLDFVERKTKQQTSSDSSEGHQSPITKENAPEFPSADKPPVSPTSPSPTMLEFTRKYNYTKAQRAESLRRTKSITSNSSRDSSDYMDMRRPERHYQTEWSRLRSQDSVIPRRPLSIGSNISAGGESYMVSPVSPTGTPEQEQGPVSNVSEVSSSPSQAPHVSTEEIKVSDSAVTQSGPASSNDSMVTSPVYHNLGKFPRRPPPPIPGGTDDKPPALPPRSSKSESFLLRNLTLQQREDLRETTVPTGVHAGPGQQQKWDSTPQEDNYAEQLRKQARRFSEQHHKPMAMQVVSSKAQMQVIVSYKQEPAQPLEAKPLQKLSSSSSSPTLVKSNQELLSSPPLRREGVSPEPPPMPTPLKNGDVELKVDLNETADFPPPPAEFMEDSDKHGDKSEDRCADDSYGSYKTQTTAREVGKYKRTVSDSNVIRSQDMKLQHVQDLNHTDITGLSSPSKPPRRKLEQERERNSPTSQRSNSPLVISEPCEQSPKSQVPAFHATEASPGLVQKSVAKPLQSTTQSVQKPSPTAQGSSGSFVSTVVQRPNSAERRSSTTEQQDTMPSVKDRIKNIEVIAQSPGSSSSHTTKFVSNVDGAKADGGTASDSLEKLESSIRSSNSFRERLRPVVRTTESSGKTCDVTQPSYMNRTNEHVNNEKVENERVNERLDNEHVNERLAENTKTESIPPQLPSRTYKQSEILNVSGGHDRPPRPSSKPGESARQLPYRQNSFQLQNSAVIHPRPYDNKRTANIQNPMNSYTNSQTGQQSQSESQRSPKQSIPEPQVPSRPQPSPQSDKAVRRSSRDMPLDQNKNVPSPEQRLHMSQLSSKTSDSRNRDNDHLQSHSVHSGDKHKLNHSSPGVTQYNEKRDNSVRPELRGDNSSDQRQNSPQSDRYNSPGQKSPAPSITSYHSGDYKHWRSGSNISSQPDNQPSSHSNRQESQSNYRTKEQSYNVRNYSDNESVQNRTKPIVPPVTVLHERQPSKEELECDLKAKELAKALSESDKKLSEVLTTDSNKSRMQYMDGLFPVSNEPIEAPRPRPAKKDSTRTEGEKEVEEERKENEPTSPLPSSYYVSPPKAMIELEIRKYGDMSQLTHDIADDETLAQKKEELLQRMIQKVEILKEDRTELLADMQDNTALGRQITAEVDKKCRHQQDKDKFRSYVEDVEKIIRLLLKLSGLLARAENTIQGLTDSTNDKIKKLTFDKRDRLHKQHEDAKELKADIDRRSIHVEKTLHDSLTPAELDNYHYFIKMKSKYTIQHQELEDKITLGQEQIAALQKSIPTRK